jgi:hypothetical protein
MENLKNLEKRETSENTEKRETVCNLDHTEITGSTLPENQSILAIDWSVSRQINLTHSDSLIPFRTPAKKTKCPHGRQKSLCKDCGGSGICEHGKQKNNCKVCVNQSKLCVPHGNFKRTCRRCKNGIECITMETPETVVQEKRKSSVSGKILLARDSN